MAGETRHIRIIAPDLWRERRMAFEADTPVSAIKLEALPGLLGKSEFDPAAYYVEYFEKEVLDESRTLADLDVPDGGVISIRAYDIDHPAPFSG